MISTLANVYYKRVAKNQLELCFNKTFSVFELERYCIEIW